MLHTTTTTRRPSLSPAHVFRPDADPLAAVRAAVARRDRLREPANAAWRDVDRDRSAKARQRSRDAAAAYAAARDEWRHAIASDLLPLLIGGAWRLPSSMAWPRGPRLSSRHDLLDHPTVFRRTYTYGRPAWHNTVLVGEPYTDRTTGALHSEAGALASMFVPFGCSAWHRRDLSGWFPGRTTLVVVARGIDPAVALRLGFEPIALAEGAVS